MSFEVRAIRESELDECLDLWTTAFAKVPRAFFARYFHGDDQFQPDYTSVCVVDGRIVAAVQVVKRLVACGDCLLTMGGIANVATLPEHRHRGYNTACLRRAIEVMAADAMDFSLLFTGIHGHYARLGWEQVPVAYRAGAPAAADASGPDGLAIRDLSGADEPSVLAIYERHNAGRPFAARRSPAYWRDWVRWGRPAWPGRARAAVRGGQVLAYCIGEIRESDARVQEACALPGEEGALDALLADLAAAVREAGVPRLSLAGPQTLAVRAAAERLLAPAELIVDRHGMVRLLGREALLRGLFPELAGRWSRAGSPSGRLTFTTPYGAVALIGAAGKLAVEPVDDAVEALTQADLFELLGGAPLDVRLPDPADAAFAAALFPSFDPWYWELDHF